MFITKLDVVNSALSTLGETGLTNLQEDHAYRDLILQFLNEETDRICARGFWFNQEYTVLQPDANSGYVYVPNDVYSVKHLHTRGFAVTQMGNRMYNAHARTYVWQCGLPVKLTRKFPYEELPYSPAAAIRDATVAKFQGRVDADRETAAACARTAAMSWEELIREDVQHQKFNMLDRHKEFNGMLATNQGHNIHGHIPGPYIRTY